MTSQERVRTAIARKVPDRVPVQDGPWRATVARWLKSEQLLPEIQVCDGMCPQVWTILTTRRTFEPGQSLFSCIRFS